MKLYSFLVISCVLCFSSLHAISTAYAQDQTAAGGPDKIKAMLLRPAGWKADWSLPGGADKGEGEWIFEARGDKVVAKILITSRGTAVRCEQNVTITSEVVKFDGCYDLDITLRFDQNDQDYPFKGKSMRGYEYKVQAK